MPSPVAREWHDVGTQSSEYDFRFDLSPQAATTASSTSMELHGLLSIHHKGASKPLQRIRIDTTLSEVPEILVDDFNFDGHEDFAVHDANNASYGGPSYSVFLYRPEGRRFLRSAQFSDLSEASLGFPEISHTRRRLRSFSKSGCCIHWKSEYDIVAGIPRRVRTETEESFLDDHCVLTIEERTSDGRWKRSTAPCPKDEGQAP